MPTLEDMFAYMHEKMILLANVHVYIHENGFDAVQQHFGSATKN
jgi:hypothetical protein